MSQKESPSYSVPTCGNKIAQAISSKMQGRRVKFVENAFNFEAHYTKTLYCHGRFQCFNSNCHHKGKVWGSAMATLEVKIVLYDTPSEYSSNNSDSDSSDSESNQLDQDLGFLCCQFALVGLRTKCSSCQAFAKPKFTIPNLKILEVTIQSLVMHHLYGEDFYVAKRDVNTSKGYHQSRLCEACDKGKCRIERERQRRRQKKTQRGKGEGILGILRPPRVMYRQKEQI